MNDRIKLAEAMGWKKCGILNEKPYGHDHSGPTGDCLGAFELPDPFTDANDDYAVLEWIRGKARGDDYTDEDYTWWCDFIGKCFDPDHQLDSPDNYSSIALYEIGDYARAALKVLQ